MATETLTCHQTSNKTGDEWTSKCPPTAVRTSSPGGSTLWEMAKLSPEQESRLTNQNTWSPYTFHQTTHSNPPPPYQCGLLNSSKLEGEPTTPWLKRHIASTTPLPLLKWSTIADTTNATLSSKLTNEPSSQKSIEKMRHSKESSTEWKRTGYMNNLPSLKAAWTSTATSPSATMPCAVQTHITTTAVDQEVLPEGEVMLPPKCADELLLWYMQWSRDLAAEMHRRHLVWDKACRTKPSLSSYRDCGCSADWRCEPHDVCFIHDSCFCPGSGSFPPVKPPHM